MKTTALAPTLLMALLALGLLLSTGCTVYKVAVDQRTAGEVATDERITLEIETAFLDDELVKYLDFNSASYLGRVYVMGEYESQAQIDRAVSLARGVDGVRSVTTYLVPKRDVADCSVAKAIRIKQELAAELLADDKVYGTNVDIRVIQCVVVLTGLLSSQAEIDRALTIARGIGGIRGVKSYLRVLNR